MKTTKTSLLLITASALSSMPSVAEVVRPTGTVQGEVRWQEKGTRSDDFESGSLNPAIWENAPASLNVGAWTFDQQNAYVADGKLNIITTQETHTRQFQDSCWDGVAGGPSQTVDRELYYKSGAVRTAAESVYGFYEAKIKGVKIFPGLSPAFWLYSDGHPYPDRNVPGSVDYSEIDIVELQQADWHGPGPDDADPVNVMDHNLHARLVNDAGNTYWLRPKAYPEQQLLNYAAPFDPSKDFHTYAVENRKDKISWYVDGVLVGSKPNLYWHRPMHLIFSMGLRRQLIKYNASCQRADPNPDNIVKQGFPEDATMQIEYVKTWEALPSIWLENTEQYKQKQFAVNEPMVVTVNYHGGSNDHVVLDKFNGITVNLVEKNAQGFVKVAATMSDSSVAADTKKYGGKITLNLDISQVTPVADLPAGHYYSLVPVFKSSNGSDIYPLTAVNNVVIVEEGGAKPIDVISVNIQPSTASLEVDESLQLSAQISPDYATDKSITWRSNDPNIVSINQSGVISGIYPGSTFVEAISHNNQSDSIEVTVTGDEPKPNLLLNPGFEEGDLVNSWDTSYGHSSVTSNQTRTGAYAGLISGNGAIEQIVSLEPNTEYTLSAWVKTAASTQKLFMGVSQYGGAPLNKQFIQNQYQKQSITFTTGDQNDSAKIWFWNDKAGVELYIDDVQLIRITPEAPAPDFDQDGIPDSLDTDDDNDGVEDTLDHLPFDAEVGLLGDLNFDFEVNNKDINLFKLKVKKNKPIHMVYDHNNDGVINNKDIPLIRQQCTNKGCKVSKDKK